MLQITWIVGLVAVTACLAFSHDEEDVRALVVRAPKVIEIRKRYTIIVPVYYVPDWTAVTTCGIIPYALGQCIPIFVSRSNSHVVQPPRMVYMGLMQPPYLHHILLRATVYVHMQATILAVSM